MNSDSNEEFSVSEEFPWLGLWPFKEHHRSYFFGRSSEILEICERIAENKLTILYGQSGLGKTSLLGAGVIPRLRDLEYHPILIRFDFKNQELTVVDQFKSAVLDLFSTRSAKQDPFEDAAIKPESSLWEIFHLKDSTLNLHQQKIVVIIDQFEELFTLGQQSDSLAKQAQTWFQQISDLLQNRPPADLESKFVQNRTFAKEFDFNEPNLRVVFALREDYLAALEGYKAQMPLLMQNRMALSPLSGKQAFDAVMGPASMGKDCLLSEEVAELIVTTVAGVDAKTPLEEIQAVPPLLSLLCEQLNFSRYKQGAKSITEDMVREQSSDILQNYYEAAFQKIIKKYRDAVKSLVEDPPMVTESGFRHSIIRSEAELVLKNRGIDNPSAIIEHLLHLRLITAERVGKHQYLEITHDVLIPLVLRSRKERHFREQQLQEKEQSKRRRARSSVIIAVTSVLLVLIVAFAIKSHDAALKDDLRRTAEEKAQLERQHREEAEKSAESLKVLSDNLSKKSSILTEAANALSKAATQVTSDVIGTRANPPKLNTKNLVQLIPSIEALQESAYTTAMTGNINVSSASKKLFDFYLLSAETFDRYGSTTLDENENDSTLKQDSLSSRHVESYLSKATNLLPELDPEHQIMGRIDLETQLAEVKFNKYGNNPMSKGNDEIERHLQNALIECDKLQDPLQRLEKWARASNLYARFKRKNLQDEASAILYNEVNKEIQNHSSPSSLLLRYQAEALNGLGNAFIHQKNEYNAKAHVPQIRKAVQQYELALELRQKLLENESENIWLKHELGLAMENLASSQILLLLGDSTISTASKTHILNRCMELRQNRLSIHESLYKADELNEVFKLGYTYAMFNFVNQKFVMQTYFKIKLKAEELKPIGALLEESRRLTPNLRDLNRLQNIFDRLTQAASKTR